MPPASGFSTEPPPRQATPLFFPIIHPPSRGYHFNTLKYPQKKCVFTSGYDECRESPTKSTRAIPIWVQRTAKAVVNVQVKSFTFRILDTPITIMGLYFGFIRKIFTPWHPICSASQLSAASRRNFRIGSGDAGALEALGLKAEAIVS
jgi:hypothetical protein